VYSLIFSIHPDLCNKKIYTDLQVKIQRGMNGSVIGECLATTAEDHTSGQVERMVIFCTDCRRTQ